MGKRARAARRGAVAAALAAALLCAPALAQVPDPFARGLAQSLSRTDQAVAQQGYSRAAGPFAGGLEQGQVRHFPLTLRAGQEYRIVGVCDERCRDLDLRSFSGGGLLVAEDARRNALPVLDIRPTATGQHTIDVEMTNCAAEGPCYFAFNVYSR